ncbi:MAG TPA: BBP7 family outer membrane beta-barrel protein, partial [Urbifossiella sp.]|nr:BBP7 family outer membrane beta-barrel protein [Urbifossiella sp.]
LAGLIPIPLQVTTASDRTTPFAVVPEFAMKFGWQVVDHINLTAGYSFMYWSRVRRAQDQYDLSPTPTDRTTDFWAQGVTLGLELRF